MGENDEVGVPWDRKKGEHVPLGLSGASLANYTSSLCMCVTHVLYLYTFSFGSCSMSACESMCVWRKKVWEARGEGKGWKEAIKEEVQWNFSNTDSRTPLGSK